MSWSRFTSAFVLSVAFGWAAAQSAGLAQREPETSVVIVRESTGTMGAADRVVVSEMGAVTGVVCSLDSKRGGDSVKGQLDAPAVRELHAPIERAARVSRQARTNPSRTFAYHVSLGPRMVQWEAGAAADEIRKLETVVSDLLTRLKRALGSGWKCPYY
jgi:hypothetical protein